MNIGTSLILIFAGALTLIAAFGCFAEIFDSYKAKFLQFGIILTILSIIFFNIAVYIIPA